jgi:hypothetical protein
LVLPLAILDRAGALQQPVGQRRFAVIDVRDDAEIARQLNGHESATMRVRQRAVNSPALVIPSQVEESLNHYVRSLLDSFYLPA